MEKITHWTELPQYTRSAIEEQYGKLTDKQWDIIVEEIDDESQSDDSDEPLFLDEQLNYYISNIKDVEADHDLWNKLTS